MAGLSYILVIWTVVGYAGAGTQVSSQFKTERDWRPIGEFHTDHWERKYSAREMCENAARELGLKTENYRCVRSK